jgi:hypothetical protein
MHDVNLEEEKRQHQQQEAYDEDEEPSTSWVQCTQQEAIYHSLSVKLNPAMMG